MLARPIVWTIAGSDSAAGAGLQADLKAFEAMGVHGCTVVAAITAQSSTEITQTQSVDLALFRAQIETLACDLPPVAIKTSMLGSAEQVQFLARFVDEERKTRKLLLVVDPVLRASSGRFLVDEPLLAAYREVLLPRADVITTNIAESELLLGSSAARNIPERARALQTQPDQTVVITGGDADSTQSQDYVLSSWASGWLSLPRVTSPHHHGTGCTFASVLAAALALGYVAVDATVLAKMATTHALRRSYPAGRGAGPVSIAADFALHIENLPAFLQDGDAAFDGTFVSVVESNMGIYPVVDSPAWVEKILKAGFRTVQLRIKTKDADVLRSAIRQSIALAEQAQAQLFINDHWELALQEKAYGVHLGQEDLNQADLATLQAAGLRLGVSTHSYWEVCRAWRIQPSYIACGPIFATQTKDMPWKAQGLDNLQYWAQLLPLPVVGIGGLQPEHTTFAAANGAAGAAVISGLLATPSFKAAAQTYQEAWEQGLKQRPGQTSTLLSARSTLTAAFR